MSRYTLGEEKYPGLFVVLDNGTPTEAVASEKASLGDRAEITGGEFRGGVFHGGVFHSGWFHGGVFHGGWLPVQIQGSMAFINCPDGKTIRIGCQNHTPEYWAENYASIGKIHGYTDEQIIEYKGYIDLVSAMIQRSNAS